MYWVREEKVLKAKPLKNLAPSDQIACRILAEAGGFDSATVISLEFNARTLEKYIYGALAPCRSSPVASASRLCWARRSIPSTQLRSCTSPVLLFLWWGVRLLRGPEAGAFWPRRGVSPLASFSRRGLIDSDGLNSRRSPRA